MAIGFDVGTWTLVCSKRGEDNEIKNKKEINAFLEIGLDNPFAFNMLNKAKVSLLKLDKVAYAIGEDAVNFAYSLGLDLKRSMVRGIINSQEKAAHIILSKMIYGLLGEVEKDGEVLAYSIPANSVNVESDADYHQKVLEEIFKKYKVNGKTVKSFPVNEGLALCYAELGHKNYTGVGISWGSGMVNFCFATLSTPIATFSSSNSGDWIDKMAAKACGETAVVINQEKMKIDLNKAPSSMLERAIISQYRILIEKTLTNIKRAISEAGNKIRAREPVDLVISGGVVSPPGFEKMFKEVLDQNPIGLPIGEIIKPKDNLLTVAKGLLVAAENAS